MMRPVVGALGMELIEAEFEHFDRRRASSGLPRANMLKSLTSLE